MGSNKGIIFRKLLAPYGDYKSSGPRLHIRENRMYIDCIDTTHEGNHKLGILYARYLYEVTHKSFIPDGYDIDHIDGDKTNDSINNLQAIPNHMNILKGGRLCDLINVDIASFRYVDYHGSVMTQTSYPVLLDDTYTPMKAIGDGTWTLGNSDQTKIDGTHYVHEFTFTTPVHLTANTAYWFMVGGNLSNQGSEWLITYQTPSVSNDLLLVKNMYNVNSWIIPNMGEFLSSQPGMYLRLSDGTDTWTI